MERDQEGVRVGMAAQVTAFVVCTVGLAVAVLLAAGWPVAAVLKWNSETPDLPKAFVLCCAVLANVSYAYWMVRGKIIARSVYRVRDWFTIVGWLVALLEWNFILAACYLLADFQFGPNY